MRIHQITEAPRRTATIAFGRMNPPTIGHAKVVEVVKSQGGDPYIFLSQSQKPKTDPLSFEQKLGFAKAFFPGVSVGDPEVRTIFDALIKVYNMGYTDLVYVAGSDRVNQFTDLINKYNGQEDQYTFDSIQVVSAGERDPDAEGAEGMSASKMRAAAAAGEFEAFKSGTPNPDMAQSMYDAVRNGMGIKDQEPVPEADAVNKRSMSGDTQSFRYTTTGGRLPTSNTSKPNDITKRFKQVDMPDEPYEFDFDSLDTAKLKKTVARLIDGLGNDKNKQVVQAYFGIGKFEKSYTLDQIATAMGVTREVIRQRLAKVLRQLRHPDLRAFMDDVPIEEVELDEMAKKVLGEPGAYIIKQGKTEYKISPRLNRNDRPSGEWQIFMKDRDDWGWDRTVGSKRDAIDWIKTQKEDIEEADGMMESLDRIIQVTGTLRRLNEVKPLNENVKNKLKSVLESWSAKYEAKLNLPDLETGDELMVGKFKNRKATIKDFTKDKHNQPVAVTDKGEQQIFKGRVKKLMPAEGKSPHKKGTTKYKNHMAAMHAGMKEEAQDIAEDGIIVKGVNTTPDVGPNEIKVQANKMGFKVDKGGRPPLLHTKAAKNSDPNTLFNLGLTESVDYVKPQFDVEWEEANRYPYLEKLGQAGWEELAGAGKVITVNTNSVKNIENTGADGSEALDDLEPEKVARLKQAMDAGTIEMPIVVKQSDGSYSLVAGNTRLIGLITTYGKAKVWLVDASNLAEGQLTERGSIGVPLSNGIIVGIAPHRELKIKKSTPGKLSYNENVEVDISGNAEKGYVLSKIVVPKELRGTGVGSKIMQDLINKADMEGAIIALTPDTAFGGSKGRLIQFYKSFGFVPNKGRNKDFRYRETMIRYPKT